MKGTKFYFHVIEPGQPDIKITTSLSSVADGWFESFVTRGENNGRIIKILLWISEEGSEKAEVIKEWTLSPVTWKNFWSSSSATWKLKRKAVYNARKGAEEDFMENLRKEYRKTFLDPDKLKKALSDKGFNS